MADQVSNTPLGEDSLKGGIYFGNLTPGGSFSNTPQTISVDLPAATVQEKVKLTLAQIKEELQIAASSQQGSSEDVLSDTSINTYLQSYVQLLIDYTDLRNYVFFGSAYTETSHNINSLRDIYPYKAFLGRNILPSTLPPTLTPIGSTTVVEFDLSTDILQSGRLTYDATGATPWYNYDLIDTNGIRYPILNVVNPTPTTFFVTVKGILNSNSYIDQSVNLTTLNKGFVLSPKLTILNGFETSLTPEQKAILAESNPTPWPRTEITNNIVYEGIEFDNWVSNPENLVQDFNTSDYGVLELPAGQEGLNLKGALALDENVTNQLLRRCIPAQLLEGNNETEDAYFTRFVLIAGKMFDNVKVYIDFLKYTKTVNYTSFNQLSPEFYKEYAAHYGFDLFDDENIGLAQTLVKTEPGLSYDAQANAVFDSTTDSRVQKTLQQEKQKRLLINLFYIFSKKGTQVAIKYMTNLLGAPQGLILLNEYVVNQNTNSKEVDNQKFYDTGFTYEIDPNYLLDPTNIANPINKPYVYRLKLYNDYIINLREISLNTNPTGAIESEIIKYGKTKYPYGYFGHGGYANLQNNNTSEAGYYLLPLTFPDKYTGVTVEYMIPRGGFIKGVGNNFDEVTIHLASLFKVGKPIDFNSVTFPAINKATKYAYGTPWIFGESNDLQNQPLSVSSVNNILQIKPEVAFDLVGLDTGTLTLTVNTPSVTTLCSISWETTIEKTARAIVNAINFSANGLTYNARIEKVDITGAVTIVIKAKQTLNGKVLTVSTTNPATYELNSDFGTASFPWGFIGGLEAGQVGAGNNGETGEYIIARLEGKDLVVRYSVIGEDPNSKSFKEPIQRVAVLKNYFRADGLNHEMRLIYRPEGVEVYKDYNYVGLARWVNPFACTTIANYYSAISLPKSEIQNCTEAVIPNYAFAYADNDGNIGNASVANAQAKGLLKINKIKAGTYTNIIVKVDGVAITAPLTYTGSSASALISQIRSNINLFVSNPNYVANAGATSKEVIIKSPMLAGSEDNNLEVTLEYETTTTNGSLTWTSEPMSNEGLTNLEDGKNPGVDQVNWWDLLIGLPVNIDMFYKRVAVFEAPSIDHPDFLDQGLSLSGLDVEKFSFNFSNQVSDANGYLTNELSVPCNFRSSSPIVGNPTSLTDDIEIYFTSNYVDNLITDLRLVNQNLLNGYTFFVEDVQDWFVLPAGTTETIDTLFQYNAWSSTLHKDYDYTDYNEVLNNYNSFAAQVLTYQGLVPFMEQIETRFRPLVAQLIPIVINMSAFGRLIKSFEKYKIHYPNIEKDCCASVNQTPARASFRLVNGANNGFSISNNQLSFTIGSNTYGPYNWVTSNNNTLELIALNINSLPTFPDLSASVVGEQLILEIDPTWWATNNGGNDINDESFTVTTSGDVVVNGVRPPLGGIEASGTSACCFSITYSYPSITNDATPLYIYEENENGAPLYIYREGENQPPTYLND